MSYPRQWTAAEYKEHLKKNREAKELERAYTQITWMRKGYESIMKMIGDEKEGSYFFIKMEVTTHMKKKNMIKHYGFLDYDHGELVRNGLSMFDVKQEKINEMKVAFDQIMRLAKGNREIKDICMKHMYDGV